MSSDEKNEKAKAIFESRFMSLVLMFALVIMCAIFVVVIWQFFGREYGLNVLMYLGIGFGGGLILTVILLITLRYTNLKHGRNLIFGITVVVLIVSLLVSVILYFSIPGELGSWAFINTSSTGLGVTTGIAITYLILAMLNSKLLEKKETLSDEQTDD